MRVVFDTNVIVSALLTPGGTADHALQLVIGGHATLILDSRLLAEYRDVLARPKLSILADEREVLLDVLEAIAEPVVAPPLRISLPDPDDRAFVEVAVAGRADAIVTGNSRHFAPAKKSPAVVPAILTPRQFLDRLRR